MKVEFHSLYWDNISPELINSHKNVMRHFNIDMQYTAKNIEHCHWLDSVVRNTKSDVVVIIEPDCIPLNREYIDKYIEYAYKNETFVGLAQASNHQAPATHIYAAPSFFAISTKCYKKLGMPSFQHTLFYDVGELITYKAEAKGIVFRCLMPNCFEKLPSTGVAWRISSTACYGIGTLFDNNIYHLYESRYSKNIDLFVQRCNQVISGTFSTDSFMSCYDLSYPVKSKPLSVMPLKWRLRRLYHFIKEGITNI